MVKNGLRINYRCFIILLFYLYSNSSAKIYSDSLHLSWEASVWYGTNGQRTVVLGKTLYHLGGVFAYGVPYGFAYHEDSYIEYKDFDKDYWLVKNIRIMDREYINAEAYNGKIYIIGGKTINGEYPSLVEIYDPSLNMVVSGAPFPNPRSNAGSVLIDSMIYIIGGSDANGYSDRMDVYNIKTDSWSSAAPLPIAVETEACYVNGKIYTIGGYNSQPHDEVYEYDPNLDTWTLSDHTPHPVSAHKLAVYGNYIFVIGDYSDLERIMCYNVLDSSWTIYSSNYFGRRHASAVILEDKLFILAGNSKRDGIFQDYRLVQSIDLSSLTNMKRSHSFEPRSIELNQNYPNPFNPYTIISYSLHHPAFVILKIYNILGREIRILVNENQVKGKHMITWDGKDQFGNPVASGFYIYELNVDGLKISKKMLYFK